MKKNNKWLMFLILLISAITVGVSQLKIGRDAGRGSRAGR